MNAQYLNNVTENFAAIAHHIADPRTMVSMDTSTVPAAGSTRRAVFDALSAPHMIGASYATCLYVALSAEISTQRNPSMNGNGIRPKGWFEQFNVQFA